MAVPNPSVAQTQDDFSNSDVQLFPWNHLLNGSLALEGAVTLFRRTSVLVGPGADADLTQLAAVACSQVAVLGWKTLRGVNWDKAWLHPGDGAVTSLLTHLLRQVQIADFVFAVTWNLREDLLCKDYFRFLWREVCYPYSKETKNEWFTAVETRQEEVDGKTIVKTYEFDALNSTNKDYTEMSEEEKSYLECDSKPGYWFHGTCRDSAVDILKNGILLNKNMPKQDFSDEKRKGFYMSPKFTSAKKWAIGIKANAAVIVFNVGTQLEDKNLQGLDLTGTGKAADWAAVVKYNRCGSVSWAPLSGHLRKMFDASDYIIGPTSSGRKIKGPPKKRNMQ